MSMARLWRDQGKPDQARELLALRRLLSLEEACSRYMLTVDEFLSWQYSVIPA